MNFISLKEYGTKPFELNTQTLFFLVKSLFLFEEFKKIISDTDIFTITKDKEYGYILRHISNKLNDERIIMCFKNPDDISYFGKEKTNMFYQLVRDAWIEELL